MSGATCGIAAPGYRLAGRSLLGNGRMVKVASRLGDTEGTIKVWLRWIIASFSAVSWLLSGATFVVPLPADAAAYNGDVQSFYNCLQKALHIPGVRSLRRIHFSGWRDPAILRARSEIWRVQNVWHANSRCFDSSIYKLDRETSGDVEVLSNKGCNIGARSKLAVFKLSHVRLQLTDELEPPFELMNAAAG